MLVGDQRISRLLNPIVQEFVGTLLMEDEPGADGFPEGRVQLVLVFPSTSARVAISAILPRQANFFRASCVVAENRFSLPAMRSTTLSV